VSGSISAFFRADHERLDRLLQQAVATPGRIDLEAFVSFRSGLLRHIALEEKILLPAVRRRRGGNPLALARRLRVDHGAIAHLLVPPPTPALVGELRSILEPHNRLEEGPGGLYSTCDALLESAAAQILEEARSYPDVKAAAFKDSPRACRVAKEALRLAERAVSDADGA
jgi:hypothetical protein